MRRFDPKQLALIVEMNLTKVAAARRMGLTPEGLDIKCKLVYDLKWDEIKALQRTIRNKELSNKRIGQMHYHGTRKPMVGGFR